MQKALKIVYRDTQSSIVQIIPQLFLEMFVMARVSPLCCSPRTAKDAAARPESRLMSQCLRVGGGKDPSHEAATMGFKEGKAHEHRLPLHLTVAKHGGSQVQRPYSPRPLVVHNFMTCLHHARRAPRCRTCQHD